MLASFGGCKSIHHYRINVQASQKLNYSEKKESLPVVIKFYQLKDDGNFKKASFNQIWDNDISYLDTDLVAQQEYTILPGSNQDITIKRYKEAHYLGVIAAYRTTEESNWKFIKKMRSGILSNEVKLILKNNQIVEEKG